MLVLGLDRNDKKVFIDDAVSRGDYFCPVCGKPLVVRKGTKNASHYAHWPKHLCTDSWNNPSDERNGYDISQWHNEWEAFYPIDNREITIALGDIKHRGDIVVNNTVVEFQHSPISSAHFQERTNFYLSAGYKVIWLFDFTDQYEKEKIDYNGFFFEWARPNSTFRDVTCTRENVDLFFQLGEENDCIVRVDNISSRGFEIFRGSKPYTKTAFLEYTGLVNGECPFPNTMNAEENDLKFREFMKKYPIKLDKAQQRAVQMVDGANLVLAVPGSGKTTVLTYRLGYMALDRGIKPESILAITYTNAAEDVMKKRLKEYFGNDIKGNFDIRTLNSLGLMIVNEKTGGTLKTADPNKTRDFVVSALKGLGESYYIDNIKLYESAISYIKSKLDQDAYFDQVVADKQLSPNFPLFFKLYNKKLKDENLIDFNDQNNLALQYLQEDPELLQKFQNRYRYICVDEAQDTNQVQYELIKLLAGKNPNLMMVGDEDQSIYGFNGSYPEALLNFRDEYDNPFILKLERNYRSTTEIVEASREFIDKNPKRSIKDMYSYRGSGNDVRIIDAENIIDQARIISENAKDNPEGMAVLYRENNSAVSVIYSLWKDNIPFHLIKNEIDVFSTSSFVKTLAMLKLVIYPRDFSSFYKIYRSIHINIYPSTAKNVCDIVSKTQRDVMTVLHEYVQENSFKDKYIVLSNVEYAIRLLDEMKKVPIREAIAKACDFVIYNEVQRDKVSRILISISDENETLRDYLMKIETLKGVIAAGCNSNEGIALSTFHSAKGLEFDKVYIIDMFDGICPSASALENRTMYLEDRRLFYVGMTRAINELNLIRFKNREDSFVDEINGYLSKRRNDDSIDVFTESDILEDQ